MCSRGISNGSDDVTCSLPAQSPTTRGFSAQEEMASLCAVNFNARVYDPLLGKFLTPDPTVEAPFNPQDLNRYSYVLNNPLSFTDPSGLCFLGCFWKSPIFDAALDLALVFVGLPWLEVELGIIDLTAGSSGLFAAATAAQSAGLFAVNAGIAGGITGYVSTGKLIGALISAGSAAAFAGLVPGLGNGIGSLLNAGAIGNYAGDFIAGGLVGGLTSVAQRGPFLAGFLSGGVGSLAGPLAGGPGFTPQGAIVSVVLGGFSSVLGGGKFANGAVTGAFAYAATTAASDPASDENVDKCGSADSKLIFQSSKGYATPDQAAQAAIEAASNMPSFDRLEYGGLIFKDSQGWEFSMYEGTEGNIPITVSSDEQVDAWWHTHPGYSGPDAFVFARGQSLNALLSKFPGGDLDVTAKIDQVTHSTVGAYLYYVPGNSVTFWPDPVTNFNNTRMVPYPAGPGQ